LSSAYAGQVSNSDKITPDLKAVMKNANDQQKIPIYIVFNNQLTLQDFDYISYDTPKKERRQIVIDRLIRHADNTQRNIRNYLTTQQSMNRVEVGEILWIVNTIVLSSDVQTINDLAENFSEIKYINYDAQYPIEMLYDEPQSRPPFWTAVPEKF